MSALSIEHFPVTPTEYLECEDVSECKDEYAKRYVFERPIETFLHGNF